MNEQINCIATHCINTNEIGAHYFAHEKSAGHLSVSESERVVYKRVVAIGILCGFFYISCHSPISQWIRYSLCVVSIFCEFCAWNRPIKYSNQTLQTSIFMSDVDGRDKILIRPASLPLNLRIRIFQQYEIRNTSHILAGTQNHNGIWKSNFTFHCSAQNYPFSFFSRIENITTTEWTHSSLFFLPAL